VKLLTKAQTAHFSAAIAQIDMLTNSMRTTLLRDEFDLDTLIELLYEASQLAEPITRSNPYLDLRLIRALEPGKSVTIGQAPDRFEARALAFNTARQLSVHHVAIPCDGMDLMPAGSPELRISARQDGRGWSVVCRKVHVV
jgi:hypothetical protein